MGHRPVRVDVIFSVAHTDMSCTTTLSLMCVHVLSIRTHVTTAVSACFAALGQIRSVRHSLSRPALLSLVGAIVVRKVDCCNSVLAGIFGNLMRRLQSVLNAATRLVFSARRSDHITPLLHELHWLKVPERIQFRLDVLGLTEVTTDTTDRN